MWWAAVKMQNCRGNAKDGPKHLVLHLPLSFIKTKAAARAFLKKDNNEEVDEKEVLKLQKQIKEIYKTLKNIIKENGHFNLVETISKDGDNVLIRL